MTNFNSRLEYASTSTSKQGALSGIKAEYTVKFFYKEHAWKASETIVRRFYTGAGAFLFGERVGRDIHSMSRKACPYHGYIEVSVSLGHNYKEKCDAEKLMEILNAGL